MAREGVGHEAPSGYREAQVEDVVFDSGALDDLLDERDRLRFLELADELDLTLLVPAVVVTEFLVGHPRDAFRAGRVLDQVKELDVSPAIGRRAASLLMRASASLGRTPSVTDGVVAVLGEIYGVVATNDEDDLAALSAAGSGFDIYDVRELKELLGRS